MCQKIKKVVIFAGGAGTRLSEKTEMIPKPLVPIGPDPVIVHIMRHFYKQGYREFILAVGYKSDEFKKYFRDYGLSKRSVVFTKYGMNIEDNDEVEDWIVRVVETGEKSTTGQRLNAVRQYINDGEPFFLTYGDSLSDVDLSKVEEQHFNSNSVATITAVNKSERFGVLETDEKGKVLSFSEKSHTKNELINGGFIICDHKVLSKVNSQSGDFSFEALTEMSKAGELGYYYHEGFWHAMDTKKDVDDLNALYLTNPELF